MICDVLFFFLSFYSSSSSDFNMQRFDKDSEVYKMIQENKESRTAPRQSNTFKMLQEVLEADEKGQKHSELKKNKCAQFKGQTRVHQCTNNTYYFYYAT